MSYLTRALVCASSLVLAQLALSQTVSGSKQTLSQQLSDWQNFGLTPPAKTKAPDKPRSIEALPPEIEDFLSTAKKSAPHEAPVKDAISLLGSRYRWGGLSSRGGFDCSSFVKVVYSKEGIDLPRTSRQQAYAGVPVKGSDLKPGDLVFFHTSRGSRVTHVGIYAGNGKFIHAANSRQGVRMDNLSDKYYRRRLVGARRVAH